MYRTALPQLSDEVFLTDSGLETDLIFHGGCDLPEFAAFVLVDDTRGTAALDAYFRRHADIAAQHGCGGSLRHRPGGPAGTGARGSDTRRRSCAASTRTPLICCPECAAAIWARPAQLW